MQVFVTGGTGVLGVPVIRMLMERSHRVVALAHSARSAERLRQSAITVVEGQLFDPGLLRQAVTGADAIVHLATRIASAAAMSDPGAWDDNNRIRIEGTRNLVEAAIANRVGAFVYPSITFVYPDCGDRWIDTMTTAPVVSPTAASSNEAEAQVERFLAAGGRGVILRLGLLYGPTSSHTLETLHNAQRGITLHRGSDEAFQSSMWNEDAASAIVAGLEHARAGIYDVVDDVPLRQRDLFQAMAEAVGRSSLRAVAPLTGGTAEIPVTELSRRVSNQRFKVAAGWAPHVRSARDGWLELARLDAATTIDEVAG